MKEYRGLIIFALCIIMLIAIAIFGAKVENKQDEKAYNQGICTLCGGQYVFSGSTYIKHGRSLYFYTCNECHHTIKIHRLMQ